MRLRIDRVHIPCYIELELACELITLETSTLEIKEMLSSFEHGEGNLRRRLGWTFEVEHAIR